MQRVKIFRGMCAQVELQVNQWLSTDLPKITNVVQTEADTNTITLTVFYISSKGD